MALVALAGVVFATVSGALPRVVADIGTAFGGFADNIFATATPPPRVVPAPGAPRLVPPASPHTNKATVTLLGTVPSEVAGRRDHVVRVYLTVPEQSAVVVGEVAVGETPSFAVRDIPLQEGPNYLAATIVGPGGESEESLVVTYRLDTSKPEMTITSPRDGATVDAETVTLRGETQARATVMARNEANGTTATSAAGSDGTFSIDLPLSPGVNGILLAATDPAGNVGTAVFSVRRGLGTLTVSISASAYRISAADLPRDVEIRAAVADPGGAALREEVVTFSLTLPGVPAITGEGVTDADGTATFRTTIPAGATLGSGLATAFVSSARHGDASARISITIVE